MPAKDGRNQALEYLPDLPPRSDYDRPAPEPATPQAPPSDLGISSLTRLFMWANGALLLFVLIGFATDTTLIVMGLVPSSDRVIDAKVVIAVIAAVAVQLSAFALCLYKEPRLATETLREDEDRGA